MPKKVEAIHNIALPRNKKELPRLRFEHGITTLSNTSAAHKVGAMLAVVLVALTSDGRNKFLRLVRRKDEHRKDEVAMDIVYSFEMLLCFWAWLKKKNIGNSVTMHCLMKSDGKFQN